MEYVTPEENRKRAGLLRVLRSIGRDPKKMSREELQAIFKKYEFGDPTTEVPDTGHRRLIEGVDIGHLPDACFIGGVDAEGALVLGRDHFGFPHESVG